MRPHLCDAQHRGGHAQVAVHMERAVPAACDGETQGKASDAEHKAQGLQRPAEVGAKEGTAVLLNSVALLPGTYSR